MTRLKTQPLEIRQNQKKQAGRPARASAVSHDHILDAVQAILEEKSFKELTIEAVAQRAGVGKPTIYKWWSSKTALVLALYEERLVATLAVPENLTTEEKIRAQVLELIRLLGGFYGKVAREIIGEGQSNPDVLRQYRDVYQSARRAFTTKIIEDAKASGQMRKDADPDVLIDMIYGPIYYRFLFEHKPLDKAFGNKIVDDVLATVKLGGKKSDSQ